MVFKSFPRNACTSTPIKNASTVVIAFNMSVIEGLSAHLDIEGLEQLEANLQQQCDNATYSLENNLAILKLYQLHPANAKPRILALALVKALMQMPHTDFLLLTYLVPDEVLRDVDPVRLLVELNTHLEKVLSAWVAVRVWLPRALPSPAHHTPPTARCVCHGRTDGRCARGARGILSSHRSQVVRLLGPPLVWHSQSEFVAFWKKAKLLEQFDLHNIKNFDDDIREFIITVLQCAYRRVPRSVLALSLNMEEGTPQVGQLVEARGWRAEKDLVEFPPNADNQERPKKFKENIQYDQLTPSIARLTASYSK